VIGAIADDDVRAPISRASCRFAETNERMFEIASTWRERLTII
jgi:hypothetical protein